MQQLFSEGLSMFLFGHGLIFHSFLVYSSYLTIFRGMLYVCLYAMPLTLNYEPFKHKIGN